LDQTSVEAHLTQEKSTKSMVDAARLADELRCEQSVAMTFEKEKKLMESTLKDLQNRLDDAETNALKSGKKAMNKMDSRIRELESDIDAENRRLADATKNLRKSERRLKELSYVQDEDRKNHERMQKMIDSLQTKVKTYKKQIEEAEEIASLNLCKFRQVQGLLADVEERADLNEKALAKARVFGRSTPLL
jgi:myosin heavy chain 6/7